MRRIKLAAVGAILALGLTACSGGGASGGASGGATTPAGGDGDGKLIGVAMPTETSERWIEIGRASCRERVF